MRIIEDTKLDFSSVLICPKRSTLRSRKDVDVTREFTFLHSKKTWKGVPIVAANMDTVGNIETAKALSEFDMLTCLHKFHTEEELMSIKKTNIWKNIALTTGIGDEDIKNIEKLIKKLSPHFFCVDVANGYTERFLHVVSKLREKYPTTTIIAGNVATGEMVEALILAGADIVKIGIGPGSVCTTRKISGVGYPQLSAVIECADAAHGVNGRIMADGGCVVPGDICKAFGGGADFVMLGGMLAGHTESGGELIKKDGKEFKVTYGMSSDIAMKKYYGKVNSYRASEGKVVELPFRGPIENTIQEILGGIRSCCTYIGARRLKDIPKCTTFVKVNKQLNDAYTRFEVS